MIYLVVMVIVMSEDVDLGGKDLPYIAMMVEHSFDAFQTSST